MQPPAGQQRILRRLFGAAHLSDFLEDVGRILQAALQTGDRHPLRVHLGGHEYPQGRGAGRAVQGHAGSAGGSGRHVRKNIQRRGEQDQQCRHLVPHRADNRPGAVGVHVLRRQGRDLRGPAPEKRGGREKRRWAVFHAQAPHSGYGTLRPPRADENHCGSLLRKRWILPRRPRAHC